MKLTGQIIRHINTITHDGKVLVVGTADGGAIYYSVKRSGFEDAAVQEGADPFGFEAWKPLDLGGSTFDASVVSRDQKNLTDVNDKPIMRSVYGDGEEVMKSADAPVQLVSAAGHVFLFRQSRAPGGRILVNRFVLDGMTNVLVPKLEVRFRRSRRRFEPQKSATSDAGAVFDNLDYRDIDGKSFLEPALELSFAGPAGNGWFAPLFVPTIEPDRGRWHLFVFDAVAGKIVLYTVGADAEGAFDVKDYLFGQVDPAKPDVTLYRPIPGIIRRTLDLQGLTVVGGPSVTTYDVQREQLTDTGPQLLRDTVRVMLAVPVRAGGTDPVKTAILDFALATDGTLSQIDTTPDKSVILRSVSRELVTPLSLLDGIKEIAVATPPPSGTIVATERGGDDLLQIRSREALSPDLVPGARVWVRGTQSYDGHYKVAAVDGATFRVEGVTFQTSEAGYWEVVQDKQTGLVFDNMIVGTEKSDGKLKVLCAAHDLKVGEAVQISGTRTADGIFPIKSIDAGKGAFVLDTPFFTGQAANLTRVMRRGLQMDIADRVDSPDLGLEPPGPQRDLGRTISAWVRIDAAGQVEQSLLRDSGGLMSLTVGPDGKVKLSLRMSDGVVRTVTDTTPLVPRIWSHFAGAVEYTTRSGGDTRLALCRDGAEVATLKIPHGLPCHLDSLLPSFEGSGYFEVEGAAPLIAGNFTIALWTRVTGGAGSHRAALACRGPFTGLTIYANPNNQWEIQTGNGGAWAGLLGPAVVENTWTHLAIVVQGPTMTLYVNGANPVSAPTTIRTPDRVLRIGAGATDGPPNFLWRGNVADAAIWSRALTPAEIAEGMTVRHAGTEAALVAYWPLDNGACRDLSRGKRHGALKGTFAPIKPAPYLHPQITPPAAPNAKKSMVMGFDGAADYVEVPAFPNPTSAVTLSAWVKSATPVWNAGACLVSKRGAFLLNPVPGERRIAMAVLINGGYAEVSFTPPDIQSWHHYAGVWDGNTLRLYIDGLQVAQANASGTLAPNADSGLRIGRAEAGNVAYFRGQIADVQLWGVARSQAEIAADMNRRLTGAESGLAGYWPLDVGPADVSPRRRNGTLKGKPVRSPDGSSFVVGGGFRGEIAEAQVWSRARTAPEVKATMHLALTGDEPGLELDYRLGAVAHETSPPSMPDFSINARTGTVTGEPYAGARPLFRQIALGKVVKYQSAELLAVSQRGRYEETFEFKVTSPDPNFDPSNADGTGLRIFSFDYWGQQSRSSKDTISFPLGSVVQGDFIKLDGGWWKASCVATVPDGVSLMRAFGLANVRGREAPSPDWTTIEVRKHHIRLISDSVTRDEYTDQAALAALSTGAPDITGKLAELNGAEARVALYEYQCGDLLARIDVANNLVRYESEKVLLIKSIDALNGQISAKSAERQRLKDDPTSYLVWLKSDYANKFVDMAGDHLVVLSGNSRDSQLFRMEHPANDPNSWLIINKATKKCPHAEGREYAVMAAEQKDGDALVRWTLKPVNDGSYLIQSAMGYYWDLVGGNRAEGAPVRFWDYTGGAYQRWRLVPSSTMTSAAKSRFDALNNDIEKLKTRLQNAKQRLDFLNDKLKQREDAAALNVLYDAAVKNHNAARTDVSARSAALIGLLPPAPPLTMRCLAVDERDLSTNGAILDFAQPVGGVRLVESCDGNVLLHYIDEQGRLRTPPYDAVADSRNTTFEQWLPDAAVRPCIQIPAATELILLDKSVSLPASGYSMEAWVQLPLDPRNGQKASMNVLAHEPPGSGDGAPLAIREGRRLGTIVDGWFFDGGVDLDQHLAAGWHHLAACVSPEKATFYADGVKVGTGATTQPALRWNNKSGATSPSNCKFPADAVTLSVWARSAVANNWTANSALVQKPNVVMMAVEGQTNKVWFHVQVANTWRSVYAPAGVVDDWHLFTGTYDGRCIRLYIDGDLKADLMVDGVMSAAPGVVQVGNDTGAPFDGDIADVSIWNVVRSWDDIRADFYRPLKADDPGLSGYWRMELTGESETPKIKDLTGKTGDLSVKGTPGDRRISAARSFQINILGNALMRPYGAGRLAEVRLWSQPLTDAEVAINARTVLTGNEPGLVGYWPLDEGAGRLVRDRSSSEAHGGYLAAGNPNAIPTWVVRTANIGNAGGRVLTIPDNGSGHVQFPGPNIAGRSFSIECWARRSGAEADKLQFIATMGSAATNAGFHFGFRETGRFTLGFYNNDVETPSQYADTDWHHWCGTYDQPSKKQRIYRDGVLVVERTATADLAAAGDLLIGVSQITPWPARFRGAIAEVRLWDRARSEAEIRAGMRRRAYGAEPGLLACYPLDTADDDDKLLERKTGAFQGRLEGGARLLLTTTLPMAGGDSLVACEYGSVEVGAEGEKRGLMRRFYGVATGGQVELLPEKRVEALTLAWIGNTQIRPTLLGYIEGAPPVPSENMTLQDDYDTATSVTLATSEETTYTWRRSEQNSQAVNIEGFVGLGWDLSAGIGVIKKATEGSAGAEFNFEHRRADTKDTTATASSQLNTADTLYLTGQKETKPMSRVLGPRWIPKNIGYATVLSGMADVFVTRLQRSGRMVSYEVRPVDGVPLDVNTITFLINPAYTLNGSLDGMVGSMAADPTFYGHVPAMRAQYGSLYPASYLRLKEAYAWKDEIDRQDKERESFFYNFDATEVDTLQDYKKSLDTPSAKPVNPSSDGGIDEKAMASQKQEMESEAKKRQDAIQARTESIGDRVRAIAAFGEWQLRMGDIQLKAGKRNIVNTYVWDADGGLHAEQQSFASTIEHSISTEVSNGGGAGGSIDAMVSAFKFSLKAMGSGAQVNSHGKSLAISKSLELSVALMPDPVIHIENNGVTDLRDNPVLPGEKVGRYRFMSFYLEGSTNHFFDFFDEVVDPEWLMSNSEEARALRQAHLQRPTKTWRVLHRVTYVERPALKKFGSK